jgi:hypothetical protein
MGKDSRVALTKAFRYLIHDMTRLWWLFYTFGVIQPVLSFDSSSSFAFTDHELVRELVGNQNLLPPHSRRLLAARIQGQKLSKRTPQSPEEVFTMLGSFLNWAASSSTKPPPSKVSEIQEQPSVVWQGAKRKKIRYGPYRMPPLSVSQSTP